ncbi:MAG TPA: YidC/Oxa1 family membrane protein insertase [Solirubrobacteraceae bacterium]|nr:YidC/Oxa1 family membrane protein insertase [Solirubrobacteraceae bacterium]
MLVTANIFQPLIDVFQSVLTAFHSIGLTWGWSIVLLTVAVRAVLVPLTFRQIKGMVRMQALQPQMKEIQQKYKEDKPRQQQEIMNFYKENNVNPLASCLPMVLQLPVFISLYYMLRESLRKDICPGLQHSFQVKYAAAHHLTSVAKAAGQTTACGSHGGSGFLFIHDLTAKATGIELIILIVLYIGSQISSTLVMSASSTMDPTQRKIMLFMPLIFVLFVIRFPAGLMLYWITTNLWTVAQQYAVRRYIGPTVAVAGGGSVDGGDGGTAVKPASGRPSGGGGGSGSGGGLGARMRDRLAQAQSEAETKRSSGGRQSGTGTAAPAKPTATTRRPASSKTGGGSSNGSSGNGSGAPPPRPPRKKKKRSGRRR